MARNFLSYRTGRLIKAILPRSLLGRSLLMILVPLVLLDLVALQMFYGSHISVVSRRFASSISGEIAVTIDLLRRYPDATDQAWLLQRVHQKFGLEMDLEPGAILPNTKWENVLGPMDDDLVQSQSTSNPSSVSQAAALEALRGPQGFIAERTAEFQARRDVIVPQLNAIEGISCHMPEGAFYVFPSCAGLLGSVAPDGRRIDSSDELVMYLLDTEGLAVLQGSAYGVPPYFRMSFAASMAVLDEGCKRLARACARLSK